MGPEVGKTQFIYLFYVRRLTGLVGGKNMTWRFLQKRTKSKSLFIKKKKFESLQLIFLLNELYLYFALCRNSSFRLPRAQDGIMWLLAGLPFSTTKWLLMLLLLKWFSVPSSTNSGLCKWLSLPTQATHKIPDTAPPFLHCVCCIYCRILHF